MALTPDVVGKYRVIRRLGEGGMGAVYLAHDQGIDREVAIKVLRADDEGLRRRFQSEAQSAGRLKHANIVTVYEYGESDGSPYLVMEFIEGRTAAHIIEFHEPLSIAGRLGLLIQACQGLEYAHRFGVVHRDIKPANLMVDRDGALKIVDFGIARTSGRDLTITGKAVGTPAYMAPEQIQGAPADHRSDLFALGMVVFELLSGRSAYSGDSDYAVINRIVNGSPNTFEHRDSKLKALMDPILSRALAREPGQRYQSAAALAHDLERVRSQYETTTAAEPALTATAVQPTVILPAAGRPHRWIAAAVLMVTVVAIAAIGLSGSWLRSAPPIEEVVRPPAGAPSQEPAPMTPAIPAPQSSTTPAAPAIVAASSPAPVPAERTASSAKLARAAASAADEQIASRLAAARAAEEGGDFDSVITHYQAVLAANPAHAAAAEGLAAARRQQSRAREAAIKGRIAEGEQTLADGAYDDAIAIFESVLKQNAGNLEALDGVARTRKAKAAEEAVFKSRLKKPPGWQ